MERSVLSTSGKTLQNAIAKHVKARSTIYSDDWAGYKGFVERYWHDWVNHSRKEYVRDDMHTNGIEGFWGLLKRSHKGVYHVMSVKHLHRYVDECAERVNSIGLTPMECIHATLPTSIAPAARMIMLPIVGSLAKPMPIPR